MSALQPCHAPAAGRFDIAQHHALIDAGRYVTALRAIQPLLAADPANPALLEAASDCYWHLERRDRAVHILRTLHEHWPDRQSAALRLAARLATLGAQDEARAVFEDILARDPACSAAVLGLCGLRRPAPDSPEAQLLRDMSSDDSRPAAERAALHNALAKVLRPHDAEAAFVHFATSNSLLAGGHDPDKIDRRVASQRRCYTAPAPQPPHAAPKLAFVVGPARSGTTLLETMLLQHPEIASIGESPALQTAFYACRAASNDPATIPHVHDWTAGASEALIDQGRATFLAQARLQTPPPEPVVLDKMPTDSFYLGFARMILPGSRAIFMLRHPLDVGLSMFTTHFAERHPYTRRLAWIGHMLRRTYDSLEDYIPKLGPDLRLQSYRAQVTQPEAQLRDILDFLDLPWEPRCLMPEASDTAILTASSLQVRQGLNTDGLGKWRQYEAELAPLIAALGGWDWIAQWQARDDALQSA